MSAPQPKNSKSTFLPLAAFICFIFVAIPVYNFAFAYASDVSIGLLIVGAGVILGLHIVTPNLDPLDHFVSQYSLAEPYGMYMRVAFYAIAVATFNLSFLLAEAGMSFSMKFVVFAAGVFTALMGVFSQKSSRIDPIQNTKFEGVMHGLSSGISFGLATISMFIFACWPPKKIIDTMEWTRAVALSLFSVTLVVVIVQFILGVRKIRLATKATGGNTSKLLQAEFNQQMSTAANSAAVSETINQPISLSKEEGESLIRANRGLGLSERILIFLFLEWEFIMSALTHTLLKKS